MYVRQRLIWLLGMGLSLSVAVSAVSETDGEAENVLELRTTVADMAHETAEVLGDSVAAGAPDEAEGWAIFSARPLADELQSGVGMARHRTGESYFLQMYGLERGDRRYALIFRDAEAFHAFRQGDLQGEVLAQLAEQDVVEAWVIGADGSRNAVEDLSNYSFTLNEELERARIAVPSRTEEWVEDEDDRIDEDDRGELVPWD